MLGHVLIVNVVVADLKFQVVDSGTFMRLLKSRDSSVQAGFPWLGNPHHPLRALTVMQIKGNDACAA